MRSSWPRPPAGPSCPATAAPSRLAWWSSSQASWSPPSLTASTHTGPPSLTSAWCCSRPDWCSSRPAPSAGRWGWRGRRSGGGRAKRPWSRTRGVFSHEQAGRHTSWFSESSEKPAVDRCCPAFGSPTCKSFRPQTQNCKLWRHCRGFICQTDAEHLASWERGQQECITIKMNYHCAKRCRGSLPLIRLLDVAALIVVGGIVVWKSAGKGEGKHPGQWFMPRLLCFNSDTCVYKVFISQGGIMDRLLWMVLDEDCV